MSFIFDKLKDFILFYVIGFKSMKVGKSLWKIILIKLFIIFVILKLLFFKNFLNTKFHNDKERANYVYQQISHVK